jgi:hypothetical protein
VNCLTYTAILLLLSACLFPVTELLHHRYSNPFVLCVLVNVGMFLATRQKLLLVGWLVIFAIFELFSLLIGEFFRSWQHLSLLIISSWITGFAAGLVGGQAQLLRTYLDTTESA